MDGESEDFTDEIEIKNVNKFRYVPVTSICVEQSFSAYKLSLTDKRHSLMKNNLEEIIVMYRRANSKFRLYTLFSLSMQ